METEVIDKLFLELSQITKATTGREIALKKELAEAAVTRPLSTEERFLLIDALKVLLEKDNPMKARLLFVNSVMDLVRDGGLVVMQL